MIPLDHRIPGYALLEGRGLEIGAFNEPAPLPPGASVAYFDVFSPEEAAALFPEIDAGKLVAPDMRGDLDKGGLDGLASGSFGFIIANHVIEHVANPIGLVDSIARLVRTGGCMVIAAPDKNFTFDSPRALTPFAHLWADYRGAVGRSDDAHYIDFLRAVKADFDGLPAADRQHHIDRSRARREHVHVWDSAMFLDFLQESFRRLGWNVKREYASVAADNRIECFTVWRKTGRSRIRRLTSRVLE